MLPTQFNLIKKFKSFHIFIKVSSDTILVKDIKIIIFNRLDYRFLSFRQFPEIQ